MSACNEKYLTYISCHIDNELTPQEEAELSEHLKTCSGCRGALAAMSLTTSALGNIGAEPPSNLEQNLIRRIKFEKEPPRRSFFRPITMIAAAAVIAITLGTGILDKMQMQKGATPENDEDVSDYTIRSSETASPELTAPSETPMESPQMGIAGNENPAPADGGTEKNPGTDSEQLEIPSIDIGDPSTVTGEGGIPPEQVGEESKYAFIITVHLSKTRASELITDLQEHEPDVEAPEVIVGKEYFMPVPAIALEDLEKAMKNRSVSYDLVKNQGSNSDSGLIKVVVDG